MYKSGKWAGSRWGKIRNCTEFSPQEVVVRKFEAYIQTFRLIRHDQHSVKFLPRNNNNNVRLIKNMNYASSMSTKF